MVTDHISVVFPDNRVTSTRTAFAYHVVTFGRCSYGRVTEAAVSAGLSLHLDAVNGASAYVEEEFQAGALFDGEAHRLCHVHGYRLA
jgi:hypothetical protein